MSLSEKNRPSKRGLKNQAHAALEAPVCASTPKLEMPGQVVDALKLWASDSGPKNLALPAIRLDGNERLVIPFTTGMLRVQTHYINSPALRDYIHCQGAGCLSCRLARQAETRDLLPVYDAVDKAVGVLAISPSLRPHALRPQLMPVLQRLKERSRLLVGLRKQDTTRFVVTTYDLPDGADDGADVILTFMELFSAGRIDLGSVFARLSNEELAAVPEVATAMAMKGIKLS